MRNLKVFLMLLAIAIFNAGCSGCAPAEQKNMPQASLAAQEVTPVADEDKISEPLAQDTRKDSDDKKTRTVFKRMNSSEDK